MTRRYDESLTAIQEMQQAGTASHKLDDMEFGRRLAVEREIEKDPRVLSTISAVWDESGTMVLYPTLVGIKGGNFRNEMNDSIDYAIIGSGEYGHKSGCEVVGQG